MKTWVYDGTEVVLTGREAVKLVKISVTKSRELKVVEITPASTETEFGWKKWVDPAQLYEITSA